MRGKIKVEKYVVIKEKLARKIFEELGDISGLYLYDGLTKLEQIIAETLKFNKEE